MAAKPKILENKYVKMLDTKFTRFLIIGGGATLIDILLSLVLYEYFNINSGIAGAISFFISANFNFNMNNYFTFTSSSRKYLHKLLIFYLISAAGLLINLLLLNLFVAWGMQFLVAKCIVVVIILIYNYFLHSLVTFK